ncbi:rho-related protein racA-like [Elysia marginata]|uniref:Rho-related protein racA-like n=1 Tax=Elysia marginata TaxID=1093978 RepID=A0AAV4GG27_9GAST|nr:rho-related protein racA-like [Elysia marginata]
MISLPGQKVYAHKVVLSTRSDVMAAMFSGHFMESNPNQISEIPIPTASLENFQALLEYLYTDHAPLEESNDLTGTLTLADENCQSRLVNLCELYISKEVDRACRDRIERAEIDVVGLLNMANIFNAKQLTTFCLHFISTNYDAFSKRKEFPNLEPEDRKYLEEHRWPPLSYMIEVEEFEKELAKRGENTDKQTETSDQEMYRPAEINRRGQTAVEKALSEIPRSSRGVQSEELGRERI